MGNWSREELKDAILEYKDMQEKVRYNLSISKSTIYKRLSERHNRTAKSFEYRMQNISYVLSLSGREWLEGLKPARNVGSNVIKEIEAILSEIEGRSTNNMMMQRADNMAALQKIINEIPHGNEKPRKESKLSTEYERDSHVVAWILKNSGGKCELCTDEAPFVTVEGIPFLEVHHVRHLSENGSDTISNAVAICPNCHRELHFGTNSKSKKELLYKKVVRLIRE